MPSFASWLTILNLIILVGGGVVGFFTVRSAIIKANQDTQTRVREALHDENELLQSRVTRLERENKRLENLIQLFIAMMKKTHNIDTEIDGDVITMRSPNNGTHVSRINANGP